MHPYRTNLLSLYSSPSLAKAKSSVGSRVCMANATLHVSLIKALIRAKSTSGGKEIRGFTFIALITSWGDGTHSEIHLPFHPQASRYRFTNVAQVTKKSVFILHRRWLERHRGPGFWQCSPQPRSRDSLVQSGMRTTSFSLAAWTGGRPVLLFGRIPETARTHTTTTQRQKRPSFTNDILENPYWLNIL